MRLATSMATAIILSLILVSDACSMEVGGGAGVLAGADSSARGSFTADGAGASTTTISSGSVMDIAESHYVQDATGKRAEMSFKVVNPEGAVGYKATLTPAEGSVPEAAKVSATQTVKIAKADSIFLHSAAKSQGSDLAGVNLTVNKTDVPASFSGSSTSTATSSSALAQVQGNVLGAVNRTGGYGGSSITGPYDITWEADSLGEKVEGSLAMQASSTSGLGTLRSSSVFSVNPAEKIGAAINASWNGDTINVAKGTYVENLILASNVTVKGAGSGKTVVDGNRSGSVIAIDDGRKVSLSGMTIVNGYAKNGSGISNNGIMTLTGSVIASNYAVCGGGIYNGPNGTATVDKTTIIGNSAEMGGGIYSDGILKLTGSTVSGSYAKLGGGVASMGTSTLTGCTITMNVGTSSGGGVLSYGNATIIKTAISSNVGDWVGGRSCQHGQPDHQRQHSHRKPCFVNPRDRRRDLHRWHSSHRQDHHLKELGHIWRRNIEQSGHSDYIQEPGLR